MEPLHLTVLQALDLHRARTVADLVLATELTADLARVLALSPRAYLLKPAGAQRLQLLAKGQG